MFLSILGTTGAAGQQWAHVPNADFEQSASEAAVPLWNNNPANLAGTVEIDPDLPHGGQGSLRLRRGEASGAVEIYSSPITVSGQPHAATTDQTWRLTYWVRTEGLGKLHGLLRTRTADGTSDFRDKPIHWWTLGAPEPGQLTDWVRREVEVDLRAGDQFLYVLFALSGPEGSQAWVDEITIQRVDDPPTAAKPSKPRKIERLVYLSHPFAYEFAFHHDPVEAAKLRIGGIGAEQLLEMERELGRRWVHAIEQLGPDDFLIINGLGMGIDIMSAEGALAPVWQAARKHLPGRFLVTFSSYGPTERFGQELRKRLAEMGWELDPTTVEAEGWGGSFEGCLPGYASRISSALGLSSGFAANLDRVYFDATFAMEAESRRRIQTTEPGVHLYLFRHPKLGEFAIYFPATAGDAGPLQYVRIDTAEGTLRFTNKAGDPRTPAYRDGYLIPLGIDSLGEPIYLWNAELSPVAFEDALSAATISIQR